MSEPQKDWFDWAESYQADWKARSSEWHNSFSPSAQQVLELATQAALSLNHDAVGAEHLVAAMLKLNSGSAAALKRAGLSLPTLRGEIEPVRGASAQEKVDWPIGYTPRCSRIIGRAQARARGSGDVRVEIEDLLVELWQIAVVYLSPDMLYQRHPSQKLLGPARVTKVDADARETIVDPVGSFALKRLSTNASNIVVNGELNGAANGSQPLRSGTNSTSSAAGSRR